MAKIPLIGNSGFKGWTLVDDEDYERVIKFRWHLKQNGYVQHVITVKPGKRQVKVFLHRYITGAPPQYMVDHINSDKRDNRKCNLRLVTNQQNQWNSRRAAHNKSGFKGVCYISRTKKWKAQITQNGKLIELGYFRTARSAAAAYDDFVRKHRGEYGYLNIPTLFDIEQETRLTGSTSVKPASNGLATD